MKALKMVLTKKWAKIWNLILLRYVFKFFCVFFLFCFGVFGLVFLGFWLVGSFFFQNIENYTTHEYPAKGRGQSIQSQSTKLAS